MKVIQIEKGNFYGIVATSSHFNLMYVYYIPSWSWNGLDLLALNRLYQCPKLQKYKFCYGHRIKKINGYKFIKVI